MSLAAQAVDAFRRGRLTVAEQLFASAVSGGYDREALTENVRFLRKIGRLSAAETAASDFLQDAQDADDQTGEIEALANLGILRRQQGDNTVSMVYFDRALQAARELADDPLADQQDRAGALQSQAFLLDNQSLSLRRQSGRSEDALEKLQEARRIQDRVGDQRGAGFTCRNTGTLLIRLGRLDEAEQALNEALALFEKVQYQAGQAAALSSLAELYEARHEYRQALEALNRSIAVSPERNPNRVAMNYGTLTRILIKLGDLVRAREYAARCARFSQELGTTESQANALHCEAQVAIADNNFDVAKSLLTDSLELFGEVSNRVGAGAVLLNLARIELTFGNTSSAREKTHQAEEALSESPHYGLSAEAQELLTFIDAADNR
jgi:tetratricopeptide (TPR) repeat protein